MSCISQLITCFTSNKIHWNGSPLGSWKGGRRNMVKEYVPATQQLANIFTEALSIFFYLYRIKLGDQDSFHFRMMGSNREKKKKWGGWSMKCQNHWVVIRAVFILFQLVFILSFCFSVLVLWTFSFCLTNLVFYLILLLMDYTYFNRWELSHQLVLL